MTVKTMNRREFLTECSFKVAGAGLVINHLAAKPVLGAEKGSAPRHPKGVEMEYRTLGKTGLSVATVSFGVMRLKEPAVLFKALDLGINFFDTAHAYQNGNNERMLGKVAKVYGRDKMFITTKAHPFFLRKEVPEKLREFAKKTMDEKFEESLRRLQTDYVDVFFVHNILDKSWPLNQEILAFLEKIKKQGKARFVGMSIHDEKAYVDAIDQTIKSPLYDVVLASLNFKSPKKHGEILQKARKANLGVIAMKTQAGGYQKASTDSVSPHQAALKWVLDKNFVDCAIPGMVNMEQLEENTGTVGKKITWSDRKILHSYYESIKDRYCLSCDSCAGTCSAQVAIPTVNRALMYCEGYGDFELGRQAYHEINDRMNGASCEECTLPTCICVNGIKIPERMNHAHKLFA